MLTVMKNLTTSILLFLLAPSLVIAQQINVRDYTSNNPESAIILQIEEYTNFNQFFLNIDDNFEIEEQKSLRAYYNQNHYFRFTMPENNDIDIFLDYKEDVISGMAAYTLGDAGNYIFHDLQYITTTPG